MSIRESILNAFVSASRQFQRCSVIVKLQAGTLSIEDYKSILREVYFYTREDPQLQAAAAIAFRGRSRGLVKTFFGHAMSEIGHDQLALNDLKFLGEPTDSISKEYPLPATTAMTAFAFYTIQHRNPIGYLGYLYFLEFMPTSQGMQFATALERMGVPGQAMSFLKEHTTADIGHNRMMEQYIQRLVVDEFDASAVIYAMHATAFYYAQMLDAAIERCATAVMFGADPLETDRLAHVS
jgi:pyrroloquinoline quinone (PQQ) biosynthesis protein C